MSVLGQGVHFISCAWYTLFFTVHHYRIAVVVQGWVTVEASLILIHHKQDGFLIHKRLCTIAPPKRQHLQVEGDEIFYAERPREINCSGFQPVSLLQHWAAINWWQLKYNVTYKKDILACKPLGRFKQNVI